LNGALASQDRAPLALASILPLIGDGARALVARALAVGAPGSSSEELVDRTLSAFRQQYTERPCVHTKLLPGVREVLALGLPSAVVTNKPRAISLLILESLGIAGSFATVYGGDDGPLKPAPDGVVAAARALGIPSDRAWMIGDGPQDVLAGRAAGCFTIALPGIAERERVLAANPHVVVDSLFEVAELVARSAPKLTSA
jgi:phosphoglycolate phosphatase